ncbi:YtxH domain-containing protein [Desulfuribacillus alkaliarsenatis]|uniref:Gas vesicle protein n=1 Tax=Desulfuribacillus alkaliarsenatis TaxID=766136 RepID=A0A1E5G5P7_9FIRM|nr:YtxH domain-containing protein [Desulfuribacillus alkaliarsenatis]OEF98511.1 hypothetical protein BHF68_02280 [Desulfuribacillus alkaliarsenatis]
MMRMSGMRTGFMIGSIIGMFAGMFISSKSGHKMREEFERTYEDTKKNIKNFAEQTSDNATETWDNIQERMYSTVNNTIEDASQAVRDMEIGEIQSKPQTSHKFQTKSDKAKTDALVQAFLASDGFKQKKK